jgi:hypothetical protein
MKTYCLSKAGALARLCFVQPSFEQRHSPICHLLRNEIALDLASVTWRFTCHDDEGCQHNGRSGDFTKGIRRSGLVSFLVAVRNSRSIVTDGYTSTQTFTSLPLVQKTLCNLENTQRGSAILDRGCRRVDIMTSADGRYLNVPRRVIR